MMTVQSKLSASLTFMYVTDMAFCDRPVPNQGISVIVQNTVGQLGWFGGKDLFLIRWWLSGLKSRGGRCPPGKVATVLSAIGFMFRKP